MLKIQDEKIYDNVDFNDQNQHIKPSMSFEDVCINLNQISQIQIGNKLIQNLQYIKIDHSIIPSISRRFTGANRKDNIEFINYIMSQSFIHLKQLSIQPNIKESKLLDLKSSKSDLDFLYLNLITLLKHSIIGMIRLKQTYVNDVYTQEEINKIIKNIREIV